MGWQWNILKIVLMYSWQRTCWAVINYMNREDEKSVKYSWSASVGSKGEYTCFLRKVLCCPCKAEGNVCCWPRGACTADRAQCLCYCSKHCEENGHEERAWSTVPEGSCTVSGGCGPQDRAIRVVKRWLLACKDRSEFVRDPWCSRAQGPLLPWVLSVLFASGSKGWCTGGMYEAWGDTWGMCSLRKRSCRGNAVDEEGKDGARTLPPHHLLRPRALLLSFSLIIKGISPGWKLLLSHSCLHLEQ